MRPILPPLGGFIGNVAANLGTDFCKGLNAKGVGKLVETFWGRDTNDVVARALRRAQIEATITLLQTWRKTLPSYLATSPNKIDHDFAHCLGAWLERQRAKGAIDAWIAGLHDERNREHTGTPSLLADALGSTFGEDVKPTERISDRAERARLLALESVLGELVAGAQAGVRTVFEPYGTASFRNFFFGDKQASSGWFSKFMSAVGTEFKNDEEFRHIWDRIQISGISELIKDQSEQASDRHQAIVALVGHARTLLEQLGGAYSVLQGDLRATQAAMERALHVAIGDSVIPLELDGEFDTRGTRRFSPRNPTIRFVGRKVEIEAPWAFLERPKKFRWWISVGSGGLGKTRLARQLCFTASEAGWRAGFLPKDFKCFGRNLDAWIP